jgi:hypothetical protein
VKAASRILILLSVCAALPAASLRYWIQPCSQPACGCHAAYPELAQWALEAWQAASSGRLTFEKTADRDTAHIRILWTGGREGLYGEARPIMVEGIRGAEVYVLPAPDQPGEKDALLRDAIVYLTCVHETGHALGLPHTDRFADIMYSFQYGGDIAEYFGRYRRLLSSRTDIRKHSGMSPEDRKQLLDLFR